MIAICSSHQCKAIQVVFFDAAPLRPANQAYEAIGVIIVQRAMDNFHRFAIQPALRIAASAGASRYKNARFDSFMDVLRTFLSEAGLERRGKPWANGDGPWLSKHEEISAPMEVRKV